MKVYGKKDVLLNLFLSLERGLICRKSRHAIQIQIDGKFNKFK